MRDGVFPSKLARRYVDVSVSDLERYTDEWLCAADVYVRTGVDDLPLRREGVVVYPIGAFHTTLCGDELRKAVQRGSVLHVGRVACYEPADLFSAWVDHYYGERCRARECGDTATSGLISRLLQSLYGKFAQRSIGWHHYPSVAPPLTWGRYAHVDAGNRTVVQCVAIGGHPFRLQADDEAYHVSPIVSACICAALRQRVRTWITIAGWRHVCYEHTDALIVDDTGLANLRRAGLIDPVALGKCKVVMSGNDLHINGVGDYVLSGERRLSGVHRNAREVAPGVFEQRRSETVWESWGRRQDDRVWWVEERIHLERAVRRRRVLDAGFTAPLELAEQFAPQALGSLDAPLAASALAPAK
jgi:hypothetical protein